MPFCPSCLKEARPGQKFCLYDKNWLYVNACPSCFNEILVNENFCVKCGADVTTNKKLQRCEFKWVGIGARITAGIIDILCCYYLLIALFQFPYAAHHPARTSFFYFLLVIFYFSFFNSGNRQTIGKQVMGIVSVRKDLKKISFLRALGKTMIVVFIFFAGFAVVNIFFSNKETISYVFAGLLSYAAYLALLLNVKRKQTIYDKFTDIIVIEVPG